MFIEMLMLRGQDSWDRALPFLFLSLTDSLLLFYSLSFFTHKRLTHNKQYNIKLTRTGAKEMQSENEGGGQNDRRRGRTQRR